MKLMIYGVILKNDKGFLDRYQYVDIDYFKALNTNALFLQILIS